jgi:hypothetical protein
MMKTRVASRAPAIKIPTIVAFGTDFFVATSSVRDSFRRLDGGGGNGESPNLLRWLI